MAMRVMFTLTDDAGVDRVETKTVAGDHVAVASGLVIIDDAGTQVFAVPLERLIAVEKAKPS